MDIWQSVGIERSHFQSLTSLLSLRYGGQLDHSNSSQVDKEDMIDSESVSSLDSNANNPMFEDTYDALRKRFLDRLAEFFSREEGPRSVVATAMLELHSDEGVNVYMARNQGFHNNGHLRKEDGALIKMIEKALSKVSLKTSGKTTLHIA